MKKEILKNAVDPKQYDNDNIYWEHNPEKNLIIQDFYFSHLLKFKEIWKNRNILEIGCGNGWLLKKLLKYKVKSIEGIEPSVQNNQYLKKIPNINFSNNTLDTFQSKKQYDVIISVMVFGHIENLENAFEKLKSMLTENGSIIIIVSSFEFYSQKRENKIIEKINNEEVLIQINSEVYHISEIIRKVDVYEKAAKKIGLKIDEIIPMKPSKELIKLSPSIAKNKDIPTQYLIKFSK